MDRTYEVLVAGELPEVAAWARDREDLDAMLVTDRRALFDRLQANPPDAIVMSAELAPDQTAADLVRRVKEHHPFCALILLVSASHYAQVGEALSHGLDAHVMRADHEAATLAVLESTLERLLEQRRPGQFVDGPLLDVAMHQAAYRHASQAIVLVDPERRVLFFNQRAQQMSRQIYDRDLAVGARIDDYTPEGDDGRARAAVRELVERAFDDEQVVLRRELAMLGRPNTVHEYCYTPVRGRDDEIIAVSISNRDLAEVREAEEKLAESEARFWNFFERLPIGSTIVDRDSRWVRVNPALASMLGYTEDEMIGRPISEFTYAEDVERTDHEHDALREGDVAYIKYEKRYRHRDGHTVWTDVTGMPLRIAADGPPQFFGIIVDITRRKQLESQLQDAEKMRVIGQLAGGVAHDFNNLLTIITSFTHYVLSELDDGEGQAYALNKVLKAAQRGSSLTEQLLAFSRRQFSDPTSLELGEVIADIRPMLERTLGSQLDIDFDLSYEPLHVWLDAGQLEQIILNLALNARDAMPRGGQLSVATDACALEHAIHGTVETIPPGDYAKLVVRDTGEGMTREVLEHAFEPFYTTKEVGAGTGLGLASTWGIVKQADGFIDIDTAPGEGATFTLYFPRSEEASSPDHSPKPARVDVEESHPRVLLVEDDDDVRESLQRVLSRRGFEIRTAASAAEALEIEEEFDDSIDVLLSDVIMPDMHGSVLAKEFSQRRPSTEIILMTGYVGELADQLDPEWSVLQKPLDLDLLIERLRSAAAS